jgi:hypothetical protein
MRRYGSFSAGYLISGESVCCRAFRFDQAIRLKTRSLLIVPGPINHRRLIDQYIPMVRLRATFDLVQRVSKLQNLVVIVLTAWRDTIVQGKETIDHTKYLTFVNLVFR